MHESMQRIKNEIFIIATKRTVLCLASLSIILMIIVIINSLVANEIICPSNLTSGDTRLSTCPY